MSAEAATLVRSWRVGRYTATLTMPRPMRGQAQSAVIEWSPSVPTELTDAEVKQYRSGRDAAIAELASRLAIRVGVLEL
jgi:hypothetical protein